MTKQQSQPCENSSGCYQDQWGLPSYTRVQQISREIWICTEAIPASMYSPNWDKIKEKVEGRNSVWAPGQSSATLTLRVAMWLALANDSIHHDAGRGLKCWCTVTHFLSGCSWKPYDHCFVNKPGLARCERDRWPRHLHCPSWTRAKYLTCEWGHPSYSIPSQATSWPQGADGPT